MMKNYTILTIALISHASKVMLKILQARLQQYVNRELPDVQAWRSPGRSSPSRPACSPTNPPATSTGRTPSASSNCCSRSPARAAWRS